MTHHVFLIGYRGAGKTTIGRMLAKALACDFADVDQLICRNCQTDIATIVAQEGWAGFRRHEAEALLQAAHGQQQVVATGGGAVVHSQVWRQIRRKIFVVWLRADIATLTARLAPAGVDDGVRPSLTGKDIRTEIEDVLAERLPLYQDLADLEVDTGRCGAQEAVQEIVAAYYQRYGRSGG